MRRWLLLSVCLGASLPAFAQDGLPGGASSLSERYGEWAVNCRSAEADVECSVSQAQVQQKTGQRVLTVEFTVEENGGLKGVLVMPFGLRLADGVALSVDDDKPIAKLPFSTCLPSGCIAPVSSENRALEGLTGAETLNATVVANDTGREITFAIPLEGFAKATARLKDLMK